MTDPAEVAERFGLGAIDQISFAVNDVAEAAKRYEAVFGPFEVTDAPLPEISYRGRPSSATLKLGFGRSGPIEIELVQVVDGECPIADHLAAHGESIHHVRFPVPELAPVQAAMEAEGFVTTFSGGSGDVRFAYLEAPAVLGGTSIELLQMPS